MNVSQALRSRYTCRAFKPDPPDRDTILAILEAASHAPSWANTQPWEIFVGGGKELEELRSACLERFRSGAPAAPDIPRPEHWPAAIDERMSRLYAARFRELKIDRDDTEARRAMAENNNRFFGAPAVVYLCMDRTLTQWSMHDLGMLSQGIMLAAEERGVATAIAYNLVIYPDLIRKAMEIPDDLAVVIGIAMGYALHDDPQNVFRSARRPLDEVVRFRGI